VQKFKITVESFFGEKSKGYLNYHANLYVLFYNLLKSSKPTAFHSISMGLMSNA